MTKPYEPRQRAIFFHDDFASGATLGYHCTIIRVRTSSMRRYPESPERWIYRILVPYFDKQMDVAARDLFVTGGLDLSIAPDERDEVRSACKLRFSTPLMKDNDSVEGAYRLPGRNWESFSFSKRDQLVPSYQFRSPVVGSRMEAGRLTYNVPASERLDRRFVLVALADVVGVTEWQS